MTERRLLLHDMSLRDGMHAKQHQISIEQMTQGVEELRDHHHYIEIGRGRKRPHEAYYSTSGYYYFYGHYYAGSVIELLDEPQKTALANWLQGLMIEVQDPAGSWFDYPLYGYGHAYGTAYGLLTLESCRRSLGTGKLEELTSARTLRDGGSN